MRSLKLVSALLLGVALIAASAPVAGADEGSITITIDRRVMPRALLNPGLFFTRGETVTVENYVIRNYLGKPIEGFIVQTASGRTTIPIDTVQGIDVDRRVERRTEDIPDIERTVKANILYTDGTQEQVLMNADFGTIEGTTELGEFFLDDPLTVRKLVFNRFEEPVEQPVEIPAPQPAPPVIVEPEAPAPPADSDGDGVPDSKDKCPDTPRGFRVDENGCLRDRDRDGVPNIVDKCPDTPRGAPVNRLGCWTVKGINFEYNKWDIKPEYYALLNESAAVLKLNSEMTIEVQGHTDEIASEEYNQVLSEKRAEATRNYFIGLGIASDRISTRGFGETRPIESNDTPDERAMNRRIEIKILSR
jgi:OOP family OmpA-OmpF porin